MATRKNGRESAKWKREEARGLFVIGVIAILIVLHYDKSLQNTPQEFLVNTLLALWTTYAVLAVIGSSSDIFGKRLSGGSHVLGLFSLGSAIAYCVGYVIFYIVNAGVSILVNLYVSSLKLPILESIAAGFGIALMVSFVGVIIVLLISPLPIAWVLARNYGKWIWLAYGVLVAALVVSLFWPMFSQSFLP